MQSNTVQPALELLCREGMRQDGPLKIQKALKQIRKEAKRNNWNDDSIESLPPEWQWRLCTARLQLGCFDWRGWKWRNPRHGHDPFNFPRWDTGAAIYPSFKEHREPEKVGRLLIYSEQGIGDQLMFAQAFRYALPYADEITIEVEPRLAQCFQRSFPEFIIQPLKDLRDASWVKEPFDAKILYGDLVARFIDNKNKLCKEPYIYADPEKVEFWDDWIEENAPKRVGFSWAGRQGYIDPSEAEDGWLNLQYGEWEVPDHLVTPPINLKEDVEDILAITYCLDRVVCVPNTLAHISGSLGIRTQVIMGLGTGQVNNAVNWRWGMPHENKTPWHPSIEIYRTLKQWQRAK